MELTVDNGMKLLAVIICVYWCPAAEAQKSASIRFENDYKDVYHLSLIIYTPDGKNQTRVSNLQPGEQKTYVFPSGTELFIADKKQEAFAMKGNDIKATGVKPTFILKDSSTIIALSALAQAYKHPNQ